MARCHGGTRHWSLQRLVSFLSKLLSLHSDLGIRSHVKTLTKGISENVHVGFNTEDEARAAYAIALKEGKVRVTDKHGQGTALS